MTNRIAANRKRLLRIPILIAVVLVFTAVLALFCACNNGSANSDTLIIGTTTVIDSLNRLASTGGEHGYNYTMLSSTLAQVPLVYKSGGEYGSVLCGIRVSDDGLSYDFTLKDGFYWHNGDAVTVNDLEFTLKRNVSADATVTLSGNTVTVTLDKVKISFLDGLASVTLMPVRLLAGEIADTITDEKSVIGCGPFKFSERNTDSGTLVFEKFDKYPYAEQVAFKKVIFRIFNSADTMRLALKSGEIDMIWNYGTGLSADSVSDLKTSDNVRLLSYSVKAIPKVLYFNNAKMTDARVKQAVRKAIDYQKIRRIFGTEASALPREGFVAPDIAGYFETAELTRDLDGAKALLAQAGYSTENKFGFELLVRSDTNDTQYADLIKTDLEETGMITVSLKNISGANAWRAYYQAGSHMASLAAVTEAGYNFDAGYATRYLLAAENYVMPPESFPSGNPVCHGNIDIGQTDNLTEFGEIRQTLADAKNSEELAAAVKAYELYIVDNAPCIALLYDSKVQALSSKISGYAVDGTFGLLCVQNFVSLKKGV